MLRCGMTFFFSIKSVQARIGRVILALMCGLATSWGAAGDVDAGFPASANGSVYGIAVQPDGKILLAGDFTGINGVSRSYLTRLNSEGGVDTGFNARLGKNARAVVLQPNGQIVVGGWFDKVAGVVRKGLARLNADGTVDPAFNPDVEGEPLCLALQPDGKIVLGGFFTKVGGVVRSNIARIHADGTLDASFDPDVNGELFCTMLQPDGKILIGGIIYDVGGVARSCLARLNADGTLDEGFNPQVGAGSMYVHCLALQADGKILVGGDFTTVNGTNCRGIARLNADGSHDTTFLPQPVGDVLSMAVQADGKILVGGSFTMIGGMSRANIAFLNPDGTADGAFNPQASTYVRSLVLQPDGKILMGGNFLTVKGASRLRVARLQNEAAVQSLENPDGGTLRWMRSGTAPEVQQVTFDVFTEVSGSWMPLGPAGRVPGGWEKTGLSLPAAGSIRARGEVRNGNGLAEMVESVMTLGAVSSGLQVEQPAGTPRANNDAMSFGATWVGSSRLVIFTIRNTRAGLLAGLDISFTGTDASEFSVFASPVQPLPALGMTTFAVRFTPNGTGVRSAVMQIASNDPAANPFTMTLTGTGTGGALNPVFNSADDVPVSSVGFSASGKTFGQLTLGFAPAPGTVLRVVENLSGNQISGAFTDLAHRGIVTAQFGGVTYNFQANYQGGAGSDLELRLASPGTVDTSLQNSGGAPVSAIVVQPDGKMLLARLGNQPVTRCKADGSVDSTWSSVFLGGSNPPEGILVSAMAVQPDGKVVIAGAFTSVSGGTPRNRIARLNANGTLDTTFNPDLNGPVRCLTVDFFGRILIGGDFTTVGGVTRNRVARLNSNGSLDTVFAADVNGGVSSIAIAASGAVIIGGDFTQVGGIRRSRMAYLSSTDGLLFTSPSVSVDGPVKCIRVQPDGKVLIGGSFTYVEGASHSGLARLTSGGGLDPSFTASVDGEVENILLQADGSILVSGQFYWVAGIHRDGLARLNASGVVDMDFAPELYHLRAITLQADGKILIGGDFMGLEGLPGTTYLARLHNIPATESLLVQSPTTIEWKRGGSAPETQWVIFETSFNNGATWSPYGEATRIAGGWSLSKIQGLPTSGLIRAMGLNLGGKADGFASPLEARTALPQVPHLVVEYPPGTPLVSGGPEIDFGTVLQAESVSRTFTLRNTGTGVLKNLGGSSGPNQNLSFGATSLDPGKNTTMTATLTFPGLLHSGTANSSFYIYSNDPAGTFNLLWKALCLNAIDSWRQRHFGSPSNSGSGANTFSYAGDGITNLMKYASGQVPTRTGTMPGVLGVDASNNLTFTYPRAREAGPSGLIFVVEWSDTLAPGSWSTEGVTEQVIGGDDLVEQIRATIPSGSGAKRFVRLRVIAVLE